MLPYILDGFLLAFLFWFALTGLRHGLIGMLGRLLASFAALAAAWLLIGPFTSLLKGMPIYLRIHDGLANSILKLFGRTAQSLPQAVASLGLPPILQRSLLAGVSAAPAAPPGPAPGAAPSPFAVLASGLASQILSAITFMILFMLILLAIRFVLGLVSQVANRLPVIGPLNRLAGLVAGIAYALLIVFVLLLIVALCAPWLPGAAKAVGETVLLAALYRGNPLLHIL